MTAAVLDLVVEKYAAFRLDLTLEEDESPLDLSGFTPRMQIRPSKASTEVLLEFSTDNGRIEVVDAPGGKLRVKIEEAATASINWESAVYDLLLIKPGETRRVIQGSVTVSEGVTR